MFSPLAGFYTSRNASLQDLVSITSWLIDGETTETVTDLIFLGSKITADGDCSHKIKRCLLLGRKAMTNLDSILKSRDITLLTKFRLVKTMVFPVVMYGCEGWTIERIFTYIFSKFFSSHPCIYMWKSKLSACVNISFLFFHKIYNEAYCYIFERSKNFYCLNSCLALIIMIGRWLPPLIILTSQPWRPLGSHINILIDNHSP